MLLIVDNQEQEESNMAAIQTPIPSTYKAVPGNSSLYYDTATGAFMQQGGTPAVDPNQWAWGDQGLLGLGGSTPLGLDQSFLSIRPEYLNGAPITASTWEEAVQQSLSGFVRSNYGVDPIFNWDPTQSGTTQGSQFLLGTMQDLANKYPGFFNTNGNLAFNNQTGALGLNHGATPSFDPLLGLNPTDKVLGFEDVPYQQIEKAVGGLQGQFLNPAYLTQSRPLAQQVAEWTSQLTNLQNQYRALPAATTTTQPGLVRSASPWNTINTGIFARDGQLTSKADPYAGQRASLTQQIAALTGQIQANNQQLTQGILGGQKQFLSLAEIQNNAALKDYNDLLFKLDISQYAPPAPITTANPKDVMQQFFNTAPYQLAFGSDPNVLNPNLDPTERFKFDPGYQFAQDEGRRQLQFDQSKKGLLESGAGARDNQQFSQGLADQNYQRYLSQQQGLFQNWQQGIAGVMNQGAQASGQIGQNNQQLAQLLAGLTSQQGSNMGSLTGQTGTNIANLFGQQGSFGGSLFANTGAAQSSNVMSAASLNAQIQAAQIAAEAQKSAAQTGAMGQIAGAGMSLLGSFL